MKNNILYIFIAIVITSCSDGIPSDEKRNAWWLDEADLSAMHQSWAEPHAGLSCDSNELSIAGKSYKRGVGSHSVSKILIDVHGHGDRIKGACGVDDESNEKATVEFYILGDGKVLWDSKRMKKGYEAREFDISIFGKQKVGLYISDAGDGINYDHADWVNLRITYRDSVPVVVQPFQTIPYVLTPAPPKEPRINGPSVYGASAGNQFLYRIPATGDRPMKFSVKGLPEGLNVFEESGLIRGRTPENGTYEVTIIAENDHGKDEKKFKIIVGQGLALTPPMGWNSWNVWGLSVDQRKVKVAARAMEAIGLADHGWTYINIDDGWEAAERTETGFLMPNEKFPDMQKLATDIHNMGLKLGIYSSPGPTTCGGYLGSYENELLDAQTWAAWGIDYVKYDWCSYDNIAKDRSIPELQKPYVFFREQLDQVNRDIVYSICQYGRGDVWQWGEEVGGNLWRTTGDIVDTWSSMSGIGFSQGKMAPYAGPGHWNDPDMLVVGKLGWGPETRPSRLSPDEQYTHISLWALLSAPMLLGCDLGQMDAFTIGLLTNDEVLAVNQDPLGKQATMVYDGIRYQIWAKDLVDGSIAIGVFNIGNNRPEEAFNWTNTEQMLNVTIGTDQIGLEKGITYKIRDLWRQRDVGTFNEYFGTPVPYHGVMMFRISPDGK
ncbi:MAG: NPCBM/NEW2 domain-containing protein [Bacteroidota bacterium]